MSPEPAPAPWVTKLQKPWRVGARLDILVNNEALFDPQTSYNSWKFYGLSKLALLHFSNEMNRRFAKTHNLQAYSLHPGGKSGTYTNVETRGFEGSPLVSFFRKLGAPIEKLFMSTAGEGAQTQIFCATSSQAQGGRYYVDCEIGEASPASGDELAAGRLWTETRGWIESLPAVSLVATHPSG